MDSIDIYADAPNAVITERLKSQAERILIKNSLSVHYIFKSLPDDNIEAVIS